jgi:pilus assembly protein CpaC
MMVSCEKREKSYDKLAIRSLRAKILSLNLLLSPLLSAGVYFSPALADGYIPESTEAGPSRHEIKVYVSNGELVELSAPAAKIFVADPAIADIQVPSPERVFIYGKKPGRTALFALRADGSKSDVMDIKVSYNTADLRRFLRQEAGDLQVSIEEAPQGIILNGVVPTPEIAERVRAIAARLAGEGNPLTNNLRLSGSTQVSIRVRIAEISRTVVKDLGVNWSAVASTGIFTFGLAGGGNSSSIVSSQGTGTGTNITAVVDALATEGLVSILAEPTLTAVSGEKASFLAGGEFPVPITQGLNSSLSVDYRKYGVSLEFIPTVLSDRLISLYVKPEVSDISTAGAVTLNNFQIPALTTRRTETTVQLGSGQSLVIGGLIQQSFSTEMDKIPGAGDMPVLGALFRSSHFRKNETELVVIVTPYVVRPISNPSNIALPTDNVAPASDLERILQGRIAREKKGNPPPVKLKGDAGFIIR